MVAIEGKNNDSPTFYLEYIKSNAANIQFTNNNFVAQVLDEDAGFDKTVYAKELKLFELVPVLADDGND